MTAREHTGWLDDFLDSHTEELVTFRRQLHAHPELSGQEVETSAAVAARLEVAGLEPRLITDGVGLLCDIGSPGPGTPVVALRADLDALAMNDEKDVHYASQVPGVAHACGHDVHTTVVLGAGLALARYMGEHGVVGGVRLVFESAEETVPGGALDAIDAGALEGVSAVYGLHCDPKLDTGRLGTRVGPISSAADMVRVELSGPGGHTARPHETVDLVTVASRLALELPEEVRDRAARLGTVSLVFGALRTGAAANVIPTHAELLGSIRTPERQAWNALPEILKDAVAVVEADLGVRATVDYTRGVPPVVNDEEATRRLERSARAVLGPGAVVDAPQSAGGDDFSWYLEQVPGSYARLGVNDPGNGREALDLHAGNFDVDEGAIGIGIRVLTAVALDTLAEAAQV